MVVYIKRDVIKTFVELEKELPSELYNNLGTSWEDYNSNKWVKLSDEQVAFWKENPTAKVKEVWDMQLTPVHVRDVTDAKNEKKSELSRYYNENLRNFKYNDTNVWLYPEERLQKKNDIEVSKNNGAKTYKLSKDLEMDINSAVGLIDCMSEREMTCNTAMETKRAEIDALEDIESVDAVDVSVGFPSEENINDTMLEEQNKVAAKNNETMQLMSLMKMTINTMDLTDEQALSVKLLYPNWSEFIGKELKQNMKVQHNDKLFKVLQVAINPVLDIDGQRPGEQGSEAMYAEINEKNQGTIDDPIPYNNNMELEEGKYYIQDGITYKCTRSTGMPVYNALKDLVGIYVEVVEK